MIVRYYIDPETKAPHIYRHEVSESEVEEILEHPAEDRLGAEGSRVALPKETTMKLSKFPPGWDTARVRQVIRHYETQADDEAVAEDEAAFQTPGQTTMEVPNDLVPAVRELIAKRKAS